MNINIGVHFDQTELLISSKDKNRIKYDNLISTDS